MNFERTEKGRKWGKVLADRVISCIFAFLNKWDLPGVLRDECCGEMRLAFRE